MLLDFRIWSNVFAVTGFPQFVEAADNRFGYTAAPSLQDSHGLLLVL